MTKSAITHAALDGSVVEIESSQDVGGPATTYLFAAQHEFECGSIPDVREIASEFELSTFDEAYALQGGTLFRGTRLITDQQGDELVYSLAVWEGRRYAVKTNVGAHYPSSEVTELFNLFTIRELPNGLWLIPRDHRGAIDYQARLAPSILKGVPNVGTLRIKQLTRETIGYLPSWQGRPVAGGELYRDQPTAHDDRILFTHVSDQAVTTLWPALDANTADVVSALSNLKVQWLKG